MTDSEDAVWAATQYARDRITKLEGMMDRASSAVGLAIELLLTAETHEDYTRVIQALEHAQDVLKGE